MQQLIECLRTMIKISDEEIDEFTRRCYPKSFPRGHTLSRPGSIPHEIFFLCEGIVRVCITDAAGVEHTVHFAMESQFIADYSCFMRNDTSVYTLQALEKTETIVIPRSAVEWGYENLEQGDRLGRLIAEFYFIYQDQRILNLYSRTPKERYDSISEVFPDIHNRAPQHMIASYLGITPVHLSRLKNPGKKQQT
jgi:hypothetical protein